MKNVIILLTVQVSEL